MKYILLVTLILSSVVMGMFLQIFGIMIMPYIVGQIASVAAIALFTLEQK